MAIKHVQYLCLSWFFCALAYISCVQDVRIKASIGTAIFVLFEKNITKSDVHLEYRYLYLALKAKNAF